MEFKKKLIKSLPNMFYLEIELSKSQILRKIMISYVKVLQYFKWYFFYYIKIVEQVKQKIGILFIIIGDIYWFICHCFIPAIERNSVLVKKKQ